MNEHSFPNAPAASHEFHQAGEKAPSPELSREANDNQHSDDEPSEYQVERHLTPGGEVEQVVHTQLDQQHRASIRSAQQRFQDGIDEHGNTMDIEQVPGAGEEYERFLNAPDSPDEFRDRMREQFRDNAEPELDHGR